MGTSTVLRDRISGGGDPERTNAIVTVGLTLRQAQFLVTVMLHSGVFVSRQCAAFAGITHGQKVHDFIEKLVARRFVTPIELGSTGRTRIFHTFTISPSMRPSATRTTGTAGESRSTGPLSA